MKILITGASGVLGRACLAEFALDAAFTEVKGLAWTRAEKNPQLVKLDLLDSASVTKYVTEFKPDAVIHCAAERRPDVAEAKPEESRKLNAETPALLASLSASLGFYLIYISTDYVFPGTNPPYEVNSTPEPLNFYGKTKRQGEVATLEGAPESSSVVRVPVLYGPAEYNGETAINCLVDIVKDQSGKHYKMDAYQTRYPTNVEDVAIFVSNLCKLPSKTQPQILHYSSTTPYTKYDMCAIIAQHLKLPIGHITEDKSVPASGTVRPKDTKLSLKVSETLGFSIEEKVDFKAWWGSYLDKTEK